MVSRSNPVSSFPACFLCLNWLLVSETFSLSCNKIVKWKINILFGLRYKHGETLAPWRQFFHLPGWFLKLVWWPSGDTSAFPAITYGDTLRFGHPPVSNLKWVGSLKFLVFSNSHYFCVDSLLIKAPTSLSSAHWAVMDHFHIWVSLGWLPSGPSKLLLLVY